jgi:hypothetical protein
MGLGVSADLVKQELSPLQGEEALKGEVLGKPVGVQAGGVLVAVAGRLAPMLIQEE